MITCNVTASNSIIYIFGGVRGGGRGCLDIRRFSRHQYRELQRAERVTGRRRFDEKYFPDTIMRSESFGPYSKEEYVSVDAGVSGVEMGVGKWGGSRSKKTNSIAS